MEPLATFEEQRVAGKRLYRLFPDRITITGKEYLGSEYEMTVNLSNLYSGTDRLTAREPLFRSGFYLLLGGTVANEILVRGLKMERFASLSGLAMTLAITGLIIMLATGRRREWVVLKNLQGQNVANISCSISQRARLNCFIEAVKAQASSFQKAGTAPNSDGKA